MKTVWIRHADFQSKTKLQAVMPSLEERTNNWASLATRNTKHETVLEQLQYKPSGKSPCLSLQYLCNIN